MKAFVYSTGKCMALLPGCKTIPGSLSKRHEAVRADNMQDNQKAFLKKWNLQFKQLFVHLQKSQIADVFHLPN